jgi:hypothetical protein
MPIKLPSQIRTGSGCYLAFRETISGTEGAQADD